MATKTEINFTELIDLSLGIPEVVNYKGLRVLLAAIVSQLGVSTVNLELNANDKSELNAVIKAHSEAKETGITLGENEAGTSQTISTRARPATGSGGGVRQEMSKSESITVTDTPGRRSPAGSGSPTVPQVIQDMEEKMLKIEGQLRVLNELPSNESLMAIARSKSVSSEDGKKNTPVSDMWQLMQCQRKAAANEEGVSKLMSMVEDILSELHGMNEKLGEHTTYISDLQNKHSNLEKDLNKINEYNKTVENRLSKLETSSGDQSKIDELQRSLDSLQNQLASYPSIEEIVTWPDFEAALKGAYKEPIHHLDSGMQTAPMLDNTRMQTIPLNDASAQTSSPVPPTPSPPPSRPVSSKSGLSTVSVHPSTEIQRLLKQLGELTGRHDLLEDRVKGLEELLAKKADMSEIEALLAQWNVPADLVNKLAELEEGLNHLRDSKNKDSKGLEDLQNTLLQLQAEVDKLNTSYVHLVDEHNVKQKHIDALYTFVDRLQENKADKEHVIMEIDVKADKNALENKVSRSQFDGTVDELSKNLHDVMEKMAGHKVAWDSAVGELKLDIDNKLDRMELDPLKSYLDNRIKSVSSKIIRSKEVETGEDAAGFRKPLQKFHCISCDRPLDMAPQAPIASLPENKGLPGSRTGRPYTTFELEQIRAAQKNGNFQDVPDYFVASRSCGGSHTLTHPHRRITRMTQMTNMVTTEDITPVMTGGRVEADIEGQDGHIYKARLDPGHMTERLPTLTQPKMSGRVKSPRVSSARGRRTLPPTRQSVEPADNHSSNNIANTVGQRPHSARGSNPNRPSSARPCNNRSMVGSDGSTGGRGSPMAVPPNTVDEVNGGAKGGASPPTPRNTKTDTITVPQPPPDNDQL